MNQPQESDPCSWIVAAIKRVDAEITEYIETLAHPEDLTFEMKKQAEEALSKARKRRGRLHDELNQCRRQKVPQILQSGETGPCVSIREDITATRERIQSDRFDLSHPEDLLPEQEVALRDDLAKAEQELKDLQRGLRECVDQHSHLESLSGWSKNS
jgi:hypothetical protein